MEVGVKTGLLMNFNVTKLKSEIKRFVLLLRALRVLRGETVCTSVKGTSFYSRQGLSTVPAQADAKIAKGHLFSSF